LSERISITPQQIITRNASGNITFNTNNLYLKTDPSGELFAGGNTRSPMIYGQNSIVDDTTSGFFSGTNYFYAPFNTNFSRDIWYEVPNLTGSASLQFSRAWERTAGSRVFESPNWRGVTYYNNNTGITESTQAIYKWNLSLFGRNEGLTDQYGNRAYNTISLIIYPTILNLPPGPINPAGGIFLLNYQANEHLNYTTTMVDGYSNVTVLTLAQLAPYNSMGVFVRPQSMYISRNPIKIALAVTP
jgi:hypothetical protein